MSNPKVTIGAFRESDAFQSKRVTLGLDSFGSDELMSYGENGEANFEESAKSAPLLMADRIGQVDKGANYTVLRSWVGDDVYTRDVAKEASVYKTSNKSLHVNYVIPNLNVGNGVNIPNVSSCVKSLCRGKVNWEVISGEGNDATTVSINDETFTVSTSDLFLYVTAKAYNKQNWNGNIVLSLDHSVFGTDAEGNNLLSRGFGLLLNFNPSISDEAGMDGNGSTDIGATASGSSVSPDFGFKLVTGDIEVFCNSTTSMQVRTFGGDEVSYNIALPSVRGKSAPQQSAVGNGLNTICFLPCWNGILVEVVGGNKYVCKKYSQESPADYIMEATGDIGNQDEDDIELKPIRLPDEKDGKNFYVDFGSQFKLSLKNCVASFAVVPLVFVNGAFDSWHLITSNKNKESDASYKYECAPITSGFTDEVRSLTETDAKDVASGLYWAMIDYAMPLSNGSRCEIYGQIIKTIVDTKDHYKNRNGTFNFSVSGSDPQGDGGDWEKYITSVQVTQGLQGGSGTITVDGLGYAGTGVSLTQSIGGISIEAKGGYNTHDGVVFKGLAMGIGVNTSTGGTELSIPLVGIEKKLQDMALINPPFLDGWKLHKACDYLFGYAGIGYSMKGDGGVELSATTEMTKAIFDWKSGTTVEQALQDVMLDTHHTYVIIDGEAVVYELDDSGLPTSLGSDRRGNIGYTEITSYDQTPDFDDLRNYCVGMGIVAQPGNGSATPYQPVIVIDTNNTTPSIPWAKIWAQARPGYCSVNNESGKSKNALDTFVDNMKKSCKRYHLTGRVTIAGDSRIKPYDTWGAYVIYSVSHSIDLQSKQWTTSFELMRSGGGSNQSGPGTGGW